MQITLTRAFSLGNRRCKPGDEIYVTRQVGTALILLKKAVEKKAELSADSKAWIAAVAPQEVAIATDSQPQINIEHSPPAPASPPLADIPSVQTQAEAPKRARAPSGRSSATSTDSKKSK